MPLGARDIMMVIRARDLASATLRNVGANVAAVEAASGMTAGKMMNISSALTGVGIGIAAVGAVGVSWLNDTTEAAMEYNQEAAKTLTQVDQLGVSLETIKDIGRDVAKAIPAPFEEMQTSLYDIFSSMDVTVSDAKLLLTEFSRAAVAGQVDLQDASRATIGILNAYGLGAEDVNRINDVMFQLVRKGVGTYGEFASTIGRAVPAAVRSGQSIETLAGMMAFLTRNNMSTAMSATSSARALESMANPIVVKRMEDMGIHVRDAAGEFLPMVGIVGQLSQKLEGMPGPERVRILQDLFKGAGGTIQARRFWDLALKNFDEFAQRTAEMGESAGTLDAAYKTMFEQPQSQIQLLTNQYEVLKTEIGDELIPIKLQLAEVALKVLQAWNGLDDGTKKLIVRIAAFVSALMLIGGIVMTVVGAVGMVIAIMMTLGATFAQAIAILMTIPAIIAAVVAAFVLLSDAPGILKALAVALLLVLAVFDPWLLIIAAVVAAGILIYKNWDTIKEKAGQLWQAMQAFWDWLSSKGVAVWHALQDAAKGAWATLQEVFQDIAALWGTVVNAFQAAWGWFSNVFGAGFKKVFDALGEQVPKVLNEIGETFDSTFVRIVSIASWAFGVIQTLFRWFGSFITDIIMPQLAVLVSYWQMAFEVLVTVIQTAVGVIITVIEFFVEAFLIGWRAFGDDIMNIFKAAWDFLTSFLASWIDFFSNLIMTFLNIFQGDWGEAWENIKGMFVAAWNAIFAAAKFIGQLLLTWIRDLPLSILNFIGDLLPLLFNKGKDLIQGLWNGALDILGIFWGWLQKLPDLILGVFDGAKDWLFDIGKDILEGLLDGLKEAWENVADFVGGLGEKIVDLKGPPSYDAVMLVNNGQLIMQGLKKGLLQGWGDVESTLRGMNSSFNINGIGSARSAGATEGSYGGGGSKGYLVVEGDLVVREEQVAADLDWWARTQGTGV